ncbi:MAG: hypothetical protein ACR2HJ_05915 [Fimbriimonadales bacterium]
MVSKIVPAILLGWAYAGPSIGDLKFLLGTWSGEVSVEQGKASITMSNRKTHRARYIESSLKVNIPGVFSADEMCHFWWDRHDEVFRSWAASSLSASPREEVGRVVDSKLVMVSLPWEVKGNSQTLRRTLSLTEIGDLDFLVELRVGENWRRQARGRLKRKK